MEYIFVSSRDYEKFLVRTGALFSGMMGDSYSGVLYREAFFDLRWARKDVPGTEGHPAAEVI